MGVYMCRVGVSRYRGEKVDLRKSEEGVCVRRGMEVWVTEGVSSVPR